MKKISKRKGKSRAKKIFNVIINVFDLLVLVVYIALSGWLIFNLISLSNIETVLRIIVIILLCFGIIGMIFFRKKKKMLCRIIMIILSIIFMFLNYTFYKIYSSLDNITSKVETKGICLVTYLDDVEDINDVTKDDVAILNSKMDMDFYEMAKEVLEDNDLKNKLVEYDGYFEIINALLNKEIKYAFLPENYNDIYNAGNSEEDKKDLSFKVLYTEQKVIENNDVEIETKDLGEPFTMLLMGTDVILDSYNADTLMVVTVNPKTMKVTMLSIPRDTYTVIACTGGKHKINSSGWYGDSCVVKTVEKYLGVKIDYYAKINFLGIVDLVNNLGGIDVNVPYAFCEQNSKRQFGKHTVYVDAGWQTLDGEQALALSRNRHYWTGWCPTKYTSDGERNDITRGQNQQLVIKAILSKLMAVRDLDQFYSILDTVSVNMTTNMPRDTILSFYNVGKDIVKKFNTSSADDIINVNRLTFKSYSTRILISGLELSMIINYDESVKYVSDEMKKNLGLLEEKPIKDFSFDINETYDPDTVKYNKLTSNLKLLPNFVGKTLGEAKDYCNKNGIKYESNSEVLSSIIATQSIGAKTDVSTIKGKTISFTIVVPEVEKPDKDNSTNDKPTVDDNKDNDTTDKPVEEPNNKPEEDSNTGNDSNTDDGTNGGMGDNSTNTEDKPTDNGGSSESGSGEGAGQEPPTSGEDNSNNGEGDSNEDVA